MYPTLPDKPFLTTITDYTVKLTYMLPSNNRIIAYGMYGLKKQPYRHDAFQLGTNGFQEGDQEHVGPVESRLGLEARVEQDVWRANVFAEARVGHWFDDWNQSSRSRDPRKEDLTTNEVFGGNRDWMRHQNRPQSTGALSYFNDQLGWQPQLQARVRDPDGSVA